jgi:hypothetical protein
LILTGCCLTPFPCHSGPAINQFEIKDLDVEVGQWEFQSQNAHSRDQPRRGFIEDEPGDFEYDDNSVVRARHALEAEVGVLGWLRMRVGVEFEKERLDDPPALFMRDDFDAPKLEEIAVEWVAVFIPVERSGVGLGLLVEYQHLLESEEPNSIVFGPILETGWENWELVLNPIFVRFFGGTPHDSKIDFAYGAHILYDLSPALDVGIEAYGTLERLWPSGTRSEEARLFGDHDLHRLGPSAYYQHIFAGGDDQQVLSIGLGLFFGVNENTPDYTFKWSVEFEF